MNLSLIQIKEITSLERLKELVKEIEEEEINIEQVLETKIKTRDEINSEYEQFLNSTELVDSLTKTCLDWFHTVNKMTETYNSATEQLVKLDQEKNEMKQSLNLMEQSQLLKELHSELNLAMTRKDFDLSITLIHKYMNLDYQKVLDSPYSNFIKEADWKEENSFENTKETVFNYLKKEFEKAMKANSLSQIQDNVHKFPLIKEHRYGLGVYSHYLQTQLDNLVDNEINKIGLEFCDKFKRLLEEASRICLQSSQLIEPSYGKGWSIILLGDLLGDINKHALGIKNQFYEIFGLNEKLRIIHTSFMATHNQKINSKNNHTQNVTLDLKELDQLLGEISLVSQKCTLFRRLFLNLARKQVDKSKENQNSLLTFDEVNSRYQWIKEEGICPSFQPIIEAFPVIEKYYLSLSTEKAIELDEYEEGNGNSSSIDDIFYLIKKGSFRSLMSCNLDTFRNSMTIYNSCFKELLQSFMLLTTQNDNTNSNKSGLNLRERLVNINNSLISSNYLKKMIKDLKEAVQRTLGASGFEEELITSFISAVELLNSTFVAFENLHKNSIKYLLETVIQPKVIAFFNQLIKDSNYIIEDLAMVRPIQSKFVDRFSTFLKPFKLHFTDDNFNHFIIGLSKILNNEMIRFLKANTYNENGLIALEEDFSIIIHFILEQSEDIINDEFDNVTFLLKIVLMEHNDELCDLVDQFSQQKILPINILELKELLSLRTEIPIQPFLDTFQEIEKAKEKEIN
ncbi:hypothetical protein K502DRAFT_364994 [Neoconidiobolus thromboides FSU 785]|nr:hypothetical protein K502DRAFT_364994 [Neoconidiobolus thromboides FSU 785]